MSNRIDSVTHSSRLAAGVEDLALELEKRSVAVDRNTKELEKLNAKVKLAEEQKILKLEAEIIEIKEDMKWVNSEEPALDLSEYDISRKLNVL